MNIIKNNYANKEQTSFITFCPNCKSEFSFYESELDVGVLGCYEKTMDCPCCNNEVTFKFDGGVRLTKDSVKFPKHFFYFGGKNAKNIETNQINEWITKAIKHLETHKDEKFCKCGAGDTMIIGLKYEDEINIIVAKNYWECDVDYEKG